MIITKQDIRQARYAMPMEIHEMLQRAVWRLPAKRSPTIRRPLGRRSVALISCGAVVAAGLLVAAIIPAAREGSERALRGFVWLLAGRDADDRIEGTSNGLSAAGQRRTAMPAATAAQRYQSTVFSRIQTQTQADKEKYTAVAAQAVPVHSSQSEGGITAAVEEAAIAGGKLFLGFRFTGLPQNCFPEEEAYSIAVAGKNLDGNGLRNGIEADDTGSLFSLEESLPVEQSALPDQFDVKITFGLRQYPEDGQGKGKQVASFELSFPMARPETLATLPQEASDQAAATSKPVATEAPDSRDQDPADDRSLTEPKGVEWAAYSDTKAMFSLEYPKGWQPDKSTGWMPKDLADKAMVLAGFRGEGGSIYACAASFDTEDLSAGADRIANCLQSATGNVYTVSGNQAYFIWSGEKAEDPSCILVHPVKPWRTIDGKPYNFLLIWGPKAYNSHILKTMTLLTSPTKVFNGVEMKSFGADIASDIALKCSIPVALESRKFTKAEGLAGIPALLAGKSEPCSRLTAGDGTVVNVLLYRPGTSDIGQAAAALSSQWEDALKGLPGGTRVEISGQPTALLRGKDTSAGSLILIRLAKPVKLGSAVYPFLIVRAPDDVLGGILATIDLKQQ